MSPRPSLPARIAPAGAPRASAQGARAAFGAVDSMLLKGMTAEQITGALGRRFGSAYEWHAWVYTCLRVRARALSSLPRCEFTGPTKKPRPVPDSPWSALLDRPSPGWTWKRLVSMTELYLGLVGEAFLVAEGIGEDLAVGEVPALLVVRPGGRAAEPIRGPDGCAIIGWRFLGRGKSIEVPAHRVCQIAYENPSDPERGLAPLDAVRTSVEGDDFAARYNRNLYRNSAVPAGVMVSPPTQPWMEKDQIEQQSTEWHDKFGGVDKVGRVAFLQAGVDFKTLAQTHIESGFYDGRRWTRDEIAGVFEVPQFFLGLTTDLKYATARESNRVFYEGTIIPEGQMIADALNASFLTRGTDPMARARAAVKGEVHVWTGFDTSTMAALRDAEGERLDRADKLTSLGYTRNEVNQHLELGLPQIPGDEGGDARLVSFGLATLPELSGTAPLAEPAPAPAPGAPPPPESGPPPAKEAPQIAPVRAHRQDTGAKRRQRGWWMLHSRVYVPGERAMLTATRTHFGRVIADVGAFLAGDSRSVVRMSASELDLYLAQKRAEWDEALRALAHPVYGKVAHAGLSVLEKQLPDGFAVLKATDPKILRFIAEKELKLVAVNDTLLSGVRDTLLEGLGDNETVGELRKRLEMEQGLSMTRARNVARTEVASCSNGARYESMKADGDIDGQEWSTSGDDNVRESHRAMDGVVIPLDGSFSVGGATLRFPGDPSGPASEICQCRCAAGPVVA